MRLGTCMLCFLWLTAFRSPGTGAVRAAAKDAAVATTQTSDPRDTLAELSSPPWLQLVVRHVYRWYVTERDVQPVVQSGQMVYWVREIRPKLDEGDKSRFGEVVMPQLSIVVHVKRADYAVPELGLQVRNDTFKIVAVERLDKPPDRQAGSMEIRQPYAQLRDELFRSRNEAAFPEGAMLERLKTAVHRQIATTPQHEKLVASGRHQTVYLSQLSPVANEYWAYWLDGRALLRFSSDIDLTDPRVWEIEKLELRLYPVDEKVVVSLDEVPGSNAFMTRDEVGRALFNCVVLGKQMEATPDDHRTNQ